MIGEDFQICRIYESFVAHSAKKYQTDTFPSLSSSLSNSVFCVLEFEIYVKLVPFQFQVQGITTDYGHVFKPKLAFSN